MEEFADPHLTRSTCSARSPRPRCSSTSYATVAATSSTSPRWLDALQDPATPSTPLPKWGINGFSEGLRQELQPDIRVNVIEPGAVATELTDHITDAHTKQATQAFVRDLAITAQDIAEVIAFAVSRPRRMTLNEILIHPTAQVG
jgi:NADP-dependent 3-hydroxy acid dehydrogenase YdfG